MNYAESVAYMQGLLRFGEKYGNHRFEELLYRLNNPHFDFRALHIAGTKGKGSTTTFVASVLHASGYKTGSYMSPFVYDLRERVQIDGEMISKEDFARWVTTIRPHIDDIAATTDLGQITEFELKTAVAFCYFSEQKVDYAVLEVGLGGRLDATNVIPPPLVAVITNIGFDHMEILGDTLELIAGEKAGIVKPGTICVTGIAGGEALAKVTSVCNDQNVPLHEVKVGRDWMTNADRTLTIRTGKRELSGLRLGMRGQFQHANAAVAMHAIDRADIRDVDDLRATYGLESAVAPGRLEIVHESNPLVILDAAHNQLASQVLTDTLISDFRALERPLVLVVGMSHRHEPSELLNELLTRITPQAVIVTEPSFRPRPAADIEREVRRLGISNVATVTPATGAAVHAVKLAAEIDDAVVLITGSFYTIGDLPQSMWRSDLFN